MGLRKQLKSRIFDVERVAKAFDIGNIDKLMEIADKELINQIVDEVLSRDDLYESKRNLFIKKLPQFRGKYDV